MSEELQNEWQCENKSDKGTFEGEITPTDFGSKLIVPRVIIAYGLHRVRLAVCGNTTDITKLQLTGSDGTTLSVHESALVAMIGTVPVPRLRTLIDVSKIILSC